MRLRLLRCLMLIVVLGLALTAQTLGSHNASGDERRNPTFDRAAETRKLYGAYEKDGAVANAVVPKDGHLDLDGSQFKPGDPLVVRPFWSDTYENAGTITAVLLTYAIPFEQDWRPLIPGDRPFSCHACAPLIGVAVFRWTGSAWKREFSRIAVTRGGAWGAPPGPVRLMKIGPHVRAIELDDAYRQAGVTTRNEQIIPFDDATISDALLVEMGQDNAGECERHRPSEEPACYSYRKVLRLRPGPNPEYYDLYAILRGTDYNSGSLYGVHGVAGEEIFRFVGGAYRSVVRHGDVTQAELAIRSRR